MKARCTLLFWIVMLLKNPGLPRTPESEVTTAELVFAPFRMMQFFKVPFAIGVVPTDPNKTTLGEVALVFSIVRLRSVLVSDPSIVTRLAPTKRIRAVLAAAPL